MGTGNHGETVYMIYICKACGEPCDLIARLDAPATRWTPEEVTNLTRCCHSENFETITEYEYETITGDKPHSSRILSPEDLREERE